MLFKSCFLTKNSFFGWLTRNLSAINQHCSIWLCNKNLMEMFPHFWIRRCSTFGKYSIFHPFQEFSANNFTSRNAILFIFSKFSMAINSLTCVSNFLFSDVYLSYLFIFKIGLSLDLSCIMSSMFIIILIIHIIKTNCLNNIIIMAELKGKLP